jgi:benzoyl-CoA reductase/2-hydroxyglutaryl-CoA dehydratase subunit BcrC/BadD/HgdB
VQNPDSLDTKLEIEAIQRNTDQSALKFSCIPGPLSPEVPFADNDFIFSTETMCSMKQHGWENASRWLMHYPNMEVEMKEYDEAYLEGKKL